MQVDGLLQIPVGDRPRTTQSLIHLDRPGPARRVRGPYDGPEAIQSRAASATGGTLISGPDDLRTWLDGQDGSRSVGQVVATFVIDPEGCMRLADRRSEHVACAAGGPVLSAGEMFFSSGPDAVVEEVSNLSTGYCPEPESWEAVARALDRIGIDHPGRITTEIVFRRCHECGERNVVKDGWFACEVCGGGLLESWNFEGVDHP